MFFNSFRSGAMRTVGLSLTALALGQMLVACGSDNSSNAPGSSPTTTVAYAPKTPIQHVIVIIGENHSFDNVYATYRPRTGQSVWNLLSQQIVNQDGTPGANFSHANQAAATDTAADAFLLSPPQTAYSGSVLPAPLTGGPQTSYLPTGSTVTTAQQTENGLDAEYYQYLLTGGTGQASKVPDTRITNVNALPTGPFQLTSATFSYDAYSASPVHRFYQMWQQLDCNISHASATNPSGCDGALFSWVETTVGSAANGIAQPATFSTSYSTTATTTGEGATALGFYNMSNGDVPYFKALADQYAISDNFHQSVNGGTGVNHIMLGHGDMLYFSDGKGNAQMPPHNTVVASGTANAGTVDEIENPNAAAGTNNWYTQDGYGGGGFGSASYGGGSYSNCSDATQPGVGPILNYLKSLPTPVASNCQAGHYYLLNNYNPGYFGNGTNAYTDTNVHNTVFTIPPQTVPSIGDVMNTANVSWKYYGDQWNNYVNDPYQLKWGVAGANSDEYCTICNPFQYDTSIMSNPTQVAAHIQDTTNLYADIANGTLPAVSFVKPSGWVDGHPDSSKLDLFEGFSKKIVDAVQANPSLWKNTAIFITFDEGGGYYDSGYVQPLDFFGDGTRIPFILVSPHANPGFVSHSYTDHVSILKFIERNWGLPVISNRSRDNLPNPIVTSSNPYVPTNGPSINDLFDMFDFPAPSN
ncbi:alkaline phosphatase family protein [Burkholderia stabilis]|uniref:alkaline phosphatase family protein n=1 Tax=Burkholderia stabilis TaxID=95485 RepID=UPI001590AF16|nr:alkaline phosphatase family protein [Burkholderia stabilis]